MANSPHSERPPTYRKWAIRLGKWAFNLFPAFRGTGGRVTWVAPDYSEVRVKLPLNWRTKNLVGTTFGGSMYGAVDPFYMIMMIERLGPGYIVWDKAASIRFRKPGTETLYARFVLDDAEIERVRVAARQAERSVDRRYQVDLVDRDGTVHATIEKVLYIREER